MKFQKFLSVVVAALVLVVSFSVVVSAEAYSLGDVNGDGVVSISDALEVLKYLAKLPDNAITKGGKDSLAWNAAVIKGGDAPSINDALEILKKLAKLENEIDNPTTPKVPDVPVVGVSNKVGNTSGNLLNMGLAAIQEDWIYYTDIDSGIWRVRTDGTGKAQVTDDLAFFINVVGDWIYYNGGNYDDDYDSVSLRKIRTDGTEKTVIKEVNGLFTCVVGDWIYYLDSDEDDIYKVKTDGTGTKQLTNSGEVSHFCVEDNYIYYDDYDDDDDDYFFITKIYKMDTDGKSVSVIDGIIFPDDDEYFFAALIVCDGWIYYEGVAMESMTTHIGKIRTDGTGAALITTPEDYKGEEYFISAYNIDGDWLYFTNGYEEIYKIRTNGTGMTKIYGDEDEFVFFVNIVGDWIYYYDVEKEGLYRMDKNGKNVTLQLTLND